MQDLSKLSTQELLGIHNGLADKPLTSWKRGRDVLIARIEKARGDVKIDTPKAKATEKPEASETAPGTTGRTIREAALEALCHVDHYEDRTKKSGPANRVAEGHPKARSVGITYLDVIDRVVAEFPGCDTSVACLRWYSVKVRAGETGYEGYRLCQRRPRAKPSRS